MTESATPAKTQPTPSPPSPGWGWGLLVLIFRLLLLGVSGSIAFLVGVTIASIFPSTVEDPPLVEQAIRKGNALLKGTAFESTPSTASLSPIEVSPSPSLPTLPEASPSVTPLPPLELSDEERDRLQAELDQLETDLQSLRDRAASVETDLGTDSVMDSVIAPLEQRVQELRQRLDPSASEPTDPQPSPPESGDRSESPTPPAPSEEASDAEQTNDAATPFIAATAPVRQRPGIPSANSLMVTLPLDVLFTTDTATLSPQTMAILDSVVSDLQTYPGATIQIAAHGDDTLSPVESRVQSFEQAKAVETYLASRLGDEGYHWVVVGYGQTYPVVPNATPSDRQRNRRLEITISPP